MCHKTLRAGCGEISDPQRTPAPKMPISVNMTDGSVQKFESGMCYSDNGEVKLKYMSYLPLDASKVKSVIVNGTNINFD